MIKLDFEEIFLASVAILTMVFIGWVLVEITKSEIADTKAKSTCMANCGITRFVTVVVERERLCLCLSDNGWVVKQ